MKRMFAKRPASLSSGLIRHKSVTDRRDLVRSVDCGKRWIDEIKPGQLWRLQVLIVCHAGHYGSQPFIELPAGL